MNHTHLRIARGMRRALTPSAGVDGPWQWGTVHIVHAGSHTVDVYLDNNTGTVTPGLNYLDSYSPTVGDAVLIARMQGPSRTARVVLGKLA